MNDCDVLHIAYAADRNYLPYLAVTLGSAFLFASDASRLVVDVLALGITDAEWEKWRASLAPHLPSGAKIVRHDVDEGLFRKYKSWHGSLAAYARLMLPDILPDVAWCVYADVDTLFTDDPLKLIAFEDDRFSMRGRREYPFKDLVDKGAWFRGRRLPFDRDKYVCSGFLLLNLAWFRANGGIAKTFAFLEAHPDVELPDQDALNAVCCETSEPLPYEWGTFGCEAFAEGRPGCIHYPGHNPWKFLDGMFPDYIDAYALWFLTARGLFGKGWRDYASHPRLGKYVRMRLLGAGFSAARRLVDVLEFVRIPFLSRYLRRHYASRKQWKEIVSCLKGLGG